MQYVVSSHNGIYMEVLAPTLVATAFIVHVLRYMRCRFTLSLFFL